LEFQTLTAEDGETLYSLQSLPKKIHLHGGDLSVSIINKLMSGENGVSKKRSAVMERFSDSETDTETERISRRRHSRFVLLMKARLLSLNNTSEMGKF
jgi:hypothetical protein